MMLKWVGMMLALLLFACSSPLRTPKAAPPEPPADQEKAPIADQKRTFDRSDKNQIVQQMESRMRVLLGQAVNRFKEIRDEFALKIKGLKLPLKIQAVEPELAEFYKAKDEIYEASVKELLEEYEKIMKDTMKLVEPKIWDVAFEVTGAEDVGKSYGARTGIAEVDEIAEATLNLINQRVGLDSLQDDGRHARYNRLFMDRIFKHDIEGMGRFSIFASEAIKHHFRKNEDVVAISVTYQKRGLAPEVPLEFRQVVRNRIIRGGSNKFMSKFQPDHTLTPNFGVLHKEENENQTVTVSRVFYPRVNMDHPSFKNLRDYTVVRDYKTAVINSETQEVMDCVSWQYQWNISHFGDVAVQKGSQPVSEQVTDELRALFDFAN